MERVPLRARVGDHGLAAAVGGVGGRRAAGWRGGGGWADLPARAHRLELGLHLLLARHGQLLLQLYVLLPRHQRLGRRDRLRHLARLLS